MQPEMMNSLKERVRAYMEGQNKCPEQIAIEIRTPPNRLKKWLAGDGPIFLHDVDKLQALVEENPMKLSELIDLELCRQKLMNASGSFPEYIDFVVEQTAGLLYADPEYQRLMQAQNETECKMKKFEGALPEEYKSLAERLHEIRADQEHEQYYFMYLQGMKASFWTLGLENVLNF